MYIESAMSVRRSRIVMSGIIFLLVCGVAAYSSYQLYLMKDPVHQQAVAQKEAKDIVNQVSQLMEPPDGTPQLATVSDAAALKATQVFFSKAVNGDVLLVYPMQAILYRSATHKIINVGPVTLDVPTVAQPSTPITPAATSSSIKKINH